MMELDEIEEMYQELINATSYDFPEEGESPNAQNGRGVYIILSPENAVLYVGKTKAKYGICQALQYHIDDDDSPFRRYYLRGDGEKLREGYQFQYILENDKEIRAYLKVYATTRLLMSNNLHP